MSAAIHPECRAGKHVNCDGTALSEKTDEIVACDCPCHDTSCGPDCCHALGRCTCARDGSARNCVHHTQEDYDAADRAIGRSAERDRLALLANAERGSQLNYDPREDFASVAPEWPT